MKTANLTPLVILSTGLLAVLGAVTCSPKEHTARAEEPEYDTITQVSSYRALLAELFDPVISYEKLKPFGDTGLGTFDQMNGEAVILEGVIYQIAFDGTIHKMDPSETTPYATLVNFRSDREVPVSAGTGREAAQQTISASFDNPNLPHALVIKGTFKTLKCRSVPKQERPYPPMMDIVANQSVFDGVEIKGTMVGFFYPRYAEALNVAGFHLHFVSDDLKFGGHVLDFTTGEGVVASVDKCERLTVYFPDTEAARKADMNADRAADMRKVNSGK